MPPFAPNPERQGSRLDLRSGYEAHRHRVEVSKTLRAAVPMQHSARAPRHCSAAAGIAHLRPRQGARAARRPARTRCSAHRLARRTRHLCRPSGCPLTTHGCCPSAPAEHTAGQHLLRRGKRPQELPAARHRTPLRRQLLRASQEHVRCGGERSGRAVAHTEPGTAPGVERQRGAHARAGRAETTALRGGSYPPLAGHATRRGCGLRSALPRSALPRALEQRQRRGGAGSAGL